MLDYDRIMAYEFAPVEHRYSSRDTILYALGLALGTDPVNPAHLRVTYEGATGFCALPTMATVLASSGFLSRIPELGITWQKVLHGEQSMTLHMALPSQGDLIGYTRITGVVDKGENRGALIYSEREILDRRTGARIATVSSTSFARADGGFGGPSGPLKAVHRIPEGDPDVVFDHATQRGSALIYRLSGDDNPIHADPELARQAGFDQPILHGLASLGIAGWSITQALGDGDPASLKHLQLRFSAPVYPGETIRTEMWRTGNEVSFRARAVERDVLVLNNGLARLA